MPVTDYKTPQEYIIKEVTVTGVKYLDKNILVNLSGLAIGSKILIPGDDITNAIQKLWGQGLFSDVKIYTTEFEKDSVSLEFFLQERHRLSELEIFGLKKGKENDVREKLDLKRGMQLTENLINNSERIIRNYLYDKKYLNSTIDIVQVDDTVIGLNNIKLRIYIDKGEKVKISDINFYGNTVFSEAKLRRTMKETKKRSLNFFKPSKFIEDAFEEDKALVLAKYNSKGYRDAELIVDSIYNVNLGRIAIDIRIYEGNQYFFRNIDWVGNTKYSTEGLNRMLKIKKGDPFDTELLNNRLNYDEDAVSNLYLDNGHLFFNVTPTIQKIEKSLVELVEKSQTIDAVQANKQRIKLQQQLDQARAKYNVLSASVSSLSKIDACVKRDLDWLLNASQYSPQEDLDDYPEIKQSVLNYGLPDLTGKTAAGLDLRNMERLLKKAILNFEPRIIRRTLDVRIVADETLFSHNAITYEIEGELWSEPVPLHMHLRTEFELENGLVSVVDFHD